MKKCSNSVNLGWIVTQWQKRREQQKPQFQSINALNHTAAEAPLEFFKMQKLLFKIIVCFGLEGTSETIRDTSCETGLLRAPSSLALNTSKCGASTTSLNNMFQSLCSMILLGTEVRLAGCSSPRLPFFFFSFNGGYFPLF